MVLLAGEEPYIEPYGWYRLPTGAMYNVQYVLATVPLTSLINIYKLQQDLKKSYIRASWHTYIS